MDVLTDLRREYKCLQRLTENTTLMMLYRRLVIAATDPRHATSVQSHLHSCMQIATPLIRFEDVPDLLTPETDGSILLLAIDPTDASAVEKVVREARVQQFPASIAVLESDQVRDLRLLDHMSTYFAGRWSWPHQCKEVSTWARHSLEPGTPFSDPVTETIGQKIRRRLINHTPSLTTMVEQLVAAASHDVTVLMEGETGTGKSFLGRLIHDCSPRRASRFLVAGCGSHSGNRVASELFGTESGIEGAGTGKFEAAGDGTLFLDEIDALSLDLQSKLLRAIETGEFEPVGSHETRTSRARVIAATNWNLADAVERGTFRRELFYRLHVVNFHIPPLRHRPEDIGPLVRGMLARYGSKFGKRLFGICPEALRSLEAFPWPGNIRQLENVVQQAVLTSAGPELKLHHLSPLVHTQLEGPAAMSLSSAFGGTLKQSRESTERANILRALEKAGQSRTRAAQILGVSRVTLYKKMKKYGLLTKSSALFPFDVAVGRGGYE